MSDRGIQIRERVGLYRYFDAQDVLLYVGISVSAVVRLSQHRDCSKWFSQIARMTVEWFTSREQAIEAEKSAIQNEHPKCNVHHNTLKRDIDNSPPELSRRLLAAKIIGFKPLYTIGDVAHVLGISTTMVRREIEDGKLRHVTILSRRAKNPIPFVTGWHLIDFIESLSE